MANTKIMLRWIVFGQTGISSKTMFAALNNVFDDTPRMGFKFDVPHDPGDFHRCLQFYKQCELDESDLETIAQKVKWFKPFTDNWDELTSLFEKELPGGSATKTYTRIQELVEDSRKIAGPNKTNTLTIKL